MQSLELRIPPLALVIIVAVAMWGCSELFPALQISIPGSPGFAIAFAVAGLVFALLGVAEFRKAKTTVDPRTPEKAATLVVHGVYRLSRNPMYVGLFMVLLGWALFLSNVLPFVLLPLFVVYMNRFQIAPEERHMRDKFGDQFSAYVAKVRRWI